MVLIWNEMKYFDYHSIDLRLNEMAENPITWVNFTKQTICPIIKHLTHCAVRKTFYSIGEKGIRMIIWDGSFTRIFMGMFNSEVGQDFCEEKSCIQKTRESREEQQQKGTKNFPLTTLTHKSWVLAHAKTT